MRLWMDCCRLWIGGFKAKAARGFDAAQNDLQNMQRTACLKPVRMRRNPAHRVETDGPPGHFCMGFTAKIGPFLIQLNSFVKGHPRQLIRDSTNFTSWDTDVFGHRFGGILRVKIAFDHCMKNRPMRGAANTAAAVQIGFHAFLIEGGEFFGAAINDQFFAIFIARQKPGFRIQQNRRICIL